MKKKKLKKITGIIGSTALVGTIAVTDVSTVTETVIKITEDNEKEEEKATTNKKNKSQQSTKLKRTKRNDQQQSESNKKDLGKIDLRSQVWNPDLGLLTDNNPATIIRAIKINNGVINANEILSVQNITRNSAVITIANGKEDIYDGTVTVTFIIRQQHVVDDSQPGPSGWIPPTNQSQQSTSINQNNGSDFMLNVPNIQQLNPVWCGPTIVESVLRYYGLQATNADISNIPQTNYEFQNALSELMNTDAEQGTAVLNTINTINAFISHFNLNGNRQYTPFLISPYINLTSIIFYNIVNYSLQNNTPVLFAYAGAKNISQYDHNHFILITGIRNYYHNVIYTYMNPWTGQYDEFDANSLISFLTPTPRLDANGSYINPQSWLTAYIGNNQSWNTLNPNYCDPTIPISEQMAITKTQSNSPYASISPISKISLSPSPIPSISVTPPPWFVTDLGEIWHNQESLFERFLALNPHLKYSDIEKTKPVKLQPEDISNNKHKLILSIWFWDESKQQKILLDLVVSYIYHPYQGSHGWRPPSYSTTPPPAVGGSKTAGMSGYGDSQIVVGRAHIEQAESKSSNNKQNQQSKGSQKKITFDKKHLINHYNIAPKTKKIEILNKINDYQNNLSEQDQANFKKAIVGIGAAGLGGISMMGGKKMISRMLVRAYSSISSGGARSTLSETTPLVVAEEVEMTQIGATVAAETTVVEGGSAVALVGLTVETFGVALLVAAVLYAGYEVINYFMQEDDFSNLTVDDIIKKYQNNKSEDQYNEIEKYYKFLAHEQLKLGFSTNRWIEIEEIYEQYKNDYATFKEEVILAIAGFHLEDHSGLGGYIHDDDFKILIKIMYNNFIKISQVFHNSTQHGWKIVTNTAGSYFQIVPE